MAVRLLFAGAMLIAVALGLARAQDGKPNVPLEKISLPPGTVVLITNNPRDANPGVNTVLLSPEEYQRLVDAAEKARRKADSGPESPSVCRLTLEHDGARPDVLQVTARYQFKAQSPRTPFALGLQKTRLVTARYDSGALAVLNTTPDDAGFTVTADEAKEYQLTLRAEATVVVRGSKSERGCEFGLPGAAITIVDGIALPSAARRVQLNERAAPKSLNPNEGVVLGAAKSLVLSWETSPPHIPGDPQFTVDAKIQTRFNDRAVATTSQLSVNVVRGQLGELRITAPATAKVRGEAGADDIVTAVEPPGDARRNVWTLRRKPSADDWVIEVQVQQQTSRRPLAVTAVGVVGASAYRGTATLIAPTGYRLNVAPRTDLVRRAEAGDEGELREQYAFWSVPTTGPLFDFDPQLSRSETELTTAIQLQLIEGAWKLTGKTDLRPLRQAVDRVEFEVPPECEDFNVGPEELVDSTAVLRDTPYGRVVQVKLIEPWRKPFAIHWGGVFQIPSGTNQATLPLPRMTTGFDKVATVTVTTAAGVVVRGTVFDADRSLPLESLPRGNGMTASFDRAPQRAELSWRSARSEIAGSASVDVMLADNQLSLRQTFTLARPPRQLTFRGPADLTGRLRLTQGGTIHQDRPGEWTVQLPSGDEREATLSLAYSQILSSLAVDQHVAIPLVWLDGAEQIETEIRAWSGQTRGGWLRPTVMPGAWSHRPARAITDQPSLPSLVLQARGTRLPLVLRYEASETGGAAAVIERALIQAAISPDGRQTVRARYAVRPLRSDTIEFSLPPTTECQVLLDGKRLDVPPSAERCRLAVEPTAARPTVSVEITYRSNHSGRGTAVISPPRPVTPLVVGEVRWQIAAPEHEWLLDPNGDCAPLWRWRWRDALFQPLPQMGIAGLNRWYRQAVAPPATEDPDPLDATLLATRPNLEPMRLWRVPHGPFILGVSLGTVGAGLLALTLRWTPRVAGLGFLTLALLIVAGARWPQISAAVLAASEPGMVVLLVTIIATVGYRRRSRRRAVFAPRSGRGQSTRVSAPATAVTVARPLSGATP